jgi:hypothetical protein
MASKKGKTVASDACELCGAWAEFSAIPLWPEAGSPPPPDLTRVALCASCLADGVPPGWHIVPLAVAGTKERAMPAPQPGDLPRTYRWNLWQRPDGTTFLSLGHPRDPIEQEQLVRTFESENWQTAAQEAFGSAPEIDAALGPLVAVLHQFPSVLTTTAKLEDTPPGPRHAVIGLTIDTVWCLRWLLGALAAISPRHGKTPWELVVDADPEWIRKLPPNGMALTLKIRLPDAELASLADFAEDLSDQTPLAEIRNALSQS